MKPIEPKKILVANRGEIAVRVMRTILELGHMPIAIYSQADAGAPHVAISHQAFCVGEGPSSQSYLRMDRILEVCRDHHVDAVHPGYGFMAENKAFAKACLDQGIVFIGPQPETIDQMGDKIRARQAALKAGLPMVPGTRELKDATEAQEEAKTIGFPVLLKAKAGGGGKGMRRVNQAEEMQEAFRLAQSEAIKAFGNGAIYMEKCLVKPRHIEVQVFCDHHEHVFVLGDRECSLQRRHQKIIEEAPAFGLSDGLRKQMADVSKALCQKVGYQGAGTIEYLVDAQENFYFLEMNTRLQVEHPVTEWVTGLDLVELQIKAAFGQEIQLSPKITGHAIEARLYAEDPNQNFMPQPGHIDHIQWPQGPGVRIDSGVTSGSDISLYYDPMIAKISVWSHDRDHAITKMKQALSETIIAGTQTNQAFLSDIINHPCFASNDISTTFVEDNMPFGGLKQPTPLEVAAAIATCELSLGQTPSPHSDAPVSDTSRWWASQLPNK